MYGWHGVVIVIAVVVSVVAAVDGLVEDGQRACSRPRARICPQAVAFYYRQINLV